VSNCDKGIVDVALANVYGTDILKPHSQFVFKFKSIDKVFGRC